MEGSTLVRLTGLWQGHTEEGEVYLSGSISPSSRLVVFLNQSKEKASDPDYVAYIASQEPREAGGKSKGKKKASGARQAGLFK